MVPNSLERWSEIAGAGLGSLGEGQAVVRPLAPRARTKSPARGEPRPLWVSEFKGAWCSAHFPFQCFLSLPELVHEVAGGRARQVLSKDGLATRVCRVLTLHPALSPSAPWEAAEWLVVVGTKLDQPLDRQPLCFSGRLSTRLLNAARALVPGVWKPGH